MRPRLSTKFLFIGLVAAALLSGCDRGKSDQAGTAKQADTPTDASNAQATALTITTAKVASEQLIRTVPATGSIYPWQELIIGAEVGGYRVAQVLVDVGSHVEKDQPLVRLATEMLDADLNSKRAALRSAQAGEVNTAAALRRGQSVSTSGALSAADLDKLKADEIAAQARVDTADTDVKTAELRLQYGTVRAPDAGTVTSRTVTVGQIVQPGTEMLRMLRQNRVEWRAEVPEAQLSRIQAGQTVEVTGVDGSVLMGRVRTVAPTVQTTNRTGLVYVDITGGNARPGMFARGSIQAGKGAGLLIPVASVVMQDGYSYVFVLKGKNTVERRRVQQAGVYGDNMEISDGLAAGDVVAVKGAGFLKDGDIVAVVNEVAAAPATGAAQASK